MPWTPPRRRRSRTAWVWAPAAPASPPRAEGALALDPPGPPRRRPGAGAADRRGGGPPPHRGRPGLPRRDRAEREAADRDGGAHRGAAAAIVTRRGLRRGSGAVTYAGRARPPP